MLELMDANVQVFTLNWLWAKNALTSFNVIQLMLYYMFM